MVAASAQPKWPERPGAALHDLFYNPRPPTSFGTLPREIPLTRLCLCYYTTTTWTKRVFPSLQPLLFSYKDFLNTDCISRERVLTFREATSQIHGRYKCPFLSRTYLLSSRAGSTNTRTIYITARIQLPKLRLMFTLTTSLLVRTRNVSARHSVQSNKLPKNDSRRNGRTKSPLARIQDKVGFEICAVCFTNQPDRSISVDIPCCLQWTRANVVIVAAKIVLFDDSIKMKHMSDVQWLNILTLSGAAGFPELLGEPDLVKIRLMLTSQTSTMEPVLATTDVCSGYR